jgi:hypothetical protein
MRKAKAKIENRKIKDKTLTQRNGEHRERKNLKFEIGNLK